MDKIIFGITGLTMGGAERVLIDTANALVDKYDITIFTIYSKGELEKELKSNIQLISLYDYQISEHGQILKWTERGRKWIIKLLNEQNEKDKGVSKMDTPSGA